jgi:hypothetical protein
MRNVGLFVFLILISFLPSAKASGLISQRGSCQALLSVLPRPTGLDELDRPQTRRAYEMLRRFRTKTLGFRRDDEWLDETGENFSIMSARNRKSQAYQASLRARALEKDLESGCHIPHSCFGRIVTGEEAILKMDGRIQLTVDRVSAREFRHMKHDLRWHGGLAGVGTALILSHSLFPHAGFEYAGALMLVPPVIYTARTLARYYPRVQRASLIMRRIAVEKRRHDWIFIHGETKIPPRIGNRQRNWITRTAERIGPEASVASDLIVFVDEDDQGKTTPSLISFLRVRDLSPKQ